ncbi:MAG TPA: aminotransferase class I/II-fold pyridoxal phosphate-dependent enzyme, partial [Bacteroidetes bacterium]|nr:aminotransferase class I/II-fold pyridoxal phosphate-dependent enzyme [Bacteroidota bacterium]
LCAPSVMQEALAIYLKENSFGEKFTHDFRKRLNDNFHFLSSELTALGFQVPLVDGGCFSWAKLPNGIDDGFQFAYALYHKTGLAIIPGEHFSSNHASWVRINIARPFVDIEKGAELLKRFLSNI